MASTMVWSASFVSLLWEIMRFFFPSYGWGGSACISLVVGGGNLIRPMVKVSMWGKDWRW